MQTINVRCINTALTGEGVTLHLTGVNGLQVIIPWKLSSENINQILELAEARVWEEVKGKNFRVIIDIDEEGNGKLIKIGNLIEEIWIDVPNEVAENESSENKSVDVVEETKEAEVTENI